jgi:hypothetical protein
MEEDNQELEQTYSGSTPEVRAKKRQKSARRFLQRFVGRLSSDQLVMIDTRLSAMHDNSQAWLERRRHWQSRFVALLRAHMPAPELEAALRDLALNPNQFDSAGYRRNVDENRRIAMDMLAELTNGLSVGQRERLSRTLGRYIADFRAISERD